MVTSENSWIVLCQQLERLRLLGSINQTEKEQVLSLANGEEDVLTRYLDTLVDAGKIQTADKDAFLEWAYLDKKRKQ